MTYTPFHRKYHTFLFSLYDITFCLLFCLIFLLFAPFHFLPEHFIVCFVQSPFRFVSFVWHNHIKFICFLQAVFAQTFSVNIPYILSSFLINIALFLCLPIYFCVLFSSTSLILRIFSCRMTKRVSSINSVLFGGLI
jgi:hypothetical protein